MTTSYDAIVIGAGPGGYVCAIRLAQLGFKTACVEKNATLGGTCLNVGCIPSKALLAASEKFVDASHHMEKMGVKTKGVSLDLGIMMKHKQDVVSANTKGIDFLFKKNKIDWLKGTGTVKGAGKLDVDGTEYTAKHIIIATIIIITPSPPSASQPLIPPSHYHHHHLYHCLPPAG